jgi:hypothetical protein
MNAARVAALLILGGCTCLQPVNERPDSGASSDASVDAGTPCVADRDCPAPTAGCTFVQCLFGWCSYYVSGICDGGVPRCAFGTDCTGTEPSVPWCSQTDAGSSFSCINGNCVWECSGGRTCTADVDAGCLQCTVPLGKSCVGSGCFNPSGPATVESSTCSNPVVAPPAPFTGTSLTFHPLGACRSEVVITNGPPIGTTVQLSTMEWIGDFPPLGGACTGEWLLTNAGRVVWNCPTCQFVILF